MFDETTNSLYKFEDGDYKPADIELKEIEERIHPDDFEPYYKNYSDVINGVRDTVVSTIRIYNPILKDFEVFEHIINPIKRDKNGIVTKYMYTKRNVSKANKAEIKQQELSINAHLALRLGGMLRWNYDADSKLSGIINENNAKTTFTEGDLQSLFMPEDRDKFILYIYELTTELFSEKTINLNVKLPEHEYFVNYNITAIACSEGDGPRSEERRVGKEC